jgi:hypothetical protein
VDTGDLQGRKAHKISAKVDPWTILVDDLVGDKNESFISTSACFEKRKTNKTLPD